MGIQENLKAVYNRLEEEHWKQDCDNPQPPVMADGVHLDRHFAEELKKCWVWKEVNGVRHPDNGPDYQATLALRDLLAQGYEAKKSARPGRNLAPVPEEEILAAVNRIANPQPKEAVDNRFKHS
jgi:hypothetical protein